MLKNMINLLHASRPGGTKSLQLAGRLNCFGWQSIEHLYDMHEQLVKSNLITKIPGLLREYVDRNPFTKLNVEPAKIMQKERVIAALRGISLMSDGDLKNYIQDTALYLRWRVGEVLYQE